ncbi:MAG TPA: Hsp70 family protein [Actinophytocola sp.]|jgi:actin-like ATPase involved in cell morphogenesis|uniref:Hsp70 family protein n=1 Tax=Actinophytocola sp. TaxID=1872138 RepID=UPI002F943580
MSYWLGIDFGTTFTAAAVLRDGEQTVELVPLGENGTSAASVVFVAPDGSLVVGDAAVRRAVTDPDRVVREVKRRIGDQTPVLVSGEPIAAHTLAARFISWVVDRATEREGRPPTAIGVTYPASWGPHKRMLLHDALMFAGVGEIRLVTEPEAAAVAYTASKHVAPGAAIGVYDLGGGTFDAAVVRQLEGGGFELAGRPEGIDSLGGIDFDEAVFEQVRAHLGAAWATLDFADPLVITAAATLRRECTEAKKALSSDTEVTIPVLLPGVSTQVRMVRGEFEAMIAPAVDATVDAMRRAIDSAGLTPADLDAVLLVGGSSRIPLVAQQVGAELDLPVTVDSDPKAVVAIGAALSVAPGKEIVPATRKPLALLPAGFSGEEQTPAPRRRRVVYALVGVSAFAAAMIGLAGIVGTDVRPLGEMAADDGIAAPAIGVEGADGTTVPKDAVDPWTGKPYTETTKPGPTRPDAKPTKASPAKLAPKPTKAKNRDALVDGAPPPPPPKTGGDDGGSDPGGTPSDTPGDTPGDTPTDTPGDTPTDTPGDTPTDTPPDTPTDTPTDTPSDTPGDTPTDTPADTTQADQPPAEPPSDPPSEGA